MSDQLVFSRILADAEEQARAARDRHLQRVQSWFDQLGPRDKQCLAELMTAFEYDTCLGLSAAAGDYWHRTHVRRM